MNTFQTVLITNGTSSYAIFMYHCGSLGWSNPSTVIGYNAASVPSHNHPFSGRAILDLICMNTSTTNWSNIVYDLTQRNIDYPEQPTLEPGNLKTFNLPEGVAFFSICVFSL